jgi:hypothetical protein
VAPLSFKKAAQTKVPDRYSAEPQAIALGMLNSALQDRNGVLDG